MDDFGVGKAGVSLLTLTDTPDVSAHPALKALEDDLNDAELAAGLIELFERARQAARDGNVDLIILSARRLACLYQLTLANGLKPIEDCLVVSDRIIDTAPASGWGWRRVLVLDDSVVLGTTLDHLVSTLKRYVGDEGTVLTAAVVVDIDQVASFLIENLNFAALHHRSLLQVEEFSLNVVQALFRHQIPFFSDFPVTDALTVPAAEWRDYLTNGPWAVADVTAPLIGDESRSALVLVPTDPMVDAVLTRLPKPVGRLIDSFKLRAYVIRISETECRLRLVPLAMLTACRESDLDSALDHINDAAGTPYPSWRKTGEPAPDAKHRLVQLFASAAILYAFVDPDNGNSIDGAGSQQCPALAEIAGISHLDETHLGLYFGLARDEARELFQGLNTWMAKHPAGSFERPYNESPARPARSPLLKELAMRRMLWEQRDLLTGTEIPAAPQPGYLTKIGLIFGGSLSSVFGFVSATYELDQRAAIKAMGSLDAYRASGLSTTERVLNQGLTLPELTEALCPELLSGPAWARSLMSLGVDIGNDLGIIVPATQTDSTGLTYRCYRLGETAYLADTPLPESARRHADLAALLSAHTPSRWAPLATLRIRASATKFATSDWDLIARSVVNGYPVTSKPIDIQNTWWAHLKDVASQPTRPMVIGHKLSRWKVDQTALLRLLELQRIVMGAVPGELKERFEGYVTKVSDEEFSAQLVQSQDGATGEATLPIAFVESKDRDWIREGAEFVWTVYDPPAGAYEPEPVSLIRFVKYPRLDEEVMDRAANAFVSYADTGTSDGAE
jgi:hypothetical protein